MMSQMKSLEDENRRLKRMFADLTEQRNPTDETTIRKNCLIMLDGLDRSPTKLGSP